MIPMDGTNPTRHDIVVLNLRIAELEEVIGDVRDWLGDILAGEEEGENLTEPLVHHIDRLSATIPHSPSSGAAPLRAEDGTPLRLTVNTSTLWDSRRATPKPGHHDHQGDR